MKTKTINYVVIGGKWHDRINGNTYHNAKIIDCRDGFTFYTGYQYGYGKSYLESAKEWLESHNVKNYIIFDGGEFYLSKKDCMNGWF